MTICEDRHEEIVYEQWDYKSKKIRPCPVCEVLDREARLVDDLESMTQDRDETEKERDRLQGIIDAETEDHS